jgi:hypothetical protein
MAFGSLPRKTGAQVRLYSRPGNDLTYRFPLIVETLARLRSRSCIIDGEAVAWATISDLISTAEVRVSARSAPDGGGDVSGGRTANPALRRIGAYIFGSVSAWFPLP